MIEILMKPSSAKGLQLAMDKGLVPGKAEDVICLDFSLDTRDLQIPLSENQQQLAEGIIDRFKGGEDIRIWRSGAAYSMCGFCFVCSLLQNGAGGVFVVPLPGFLENPKTGRVIECVNWSQIPCELFSETLEQQRELTAQEVSAYGRVWKRTVRENKPLRVMLNGSLMGVDADFYDFLLWQNLGSEPQTEAAVLGNILAAAQVSMPETWFAGRIEHFIQTGKIQVRQISRNEYSRTICLAADTDAAGRS
ncbi:MAG: DUF1835 domain-containing protein [Erysipelotrichaceae bacterium]|nr:DUF1835 domain-containing protein [Erysipelotrichaceae bacterium]